MIDTLPFEEGLGSARDKFCSTVRVYFRASTICLKMVSEDSDQHVVSITSLDMID